MGMPSALEVCREDLFTADKDLRDKYPAAIADKVIRIRDMYMQYVSDPGSTDARVVDDISGRYGVSRATCYADLHTVKALLPAINSAKKEFHRWCYNEMMLELIENARKNKDLKTLERALTSYAKVNRADQEDEKEVPYDQIKVQPFTATEDPSVLGIKPIPNIQQRISEMIERYSRESRDIEDVEFEDADLESETLFPEDFGSVSENGRESESERERGSETRIRI